MQQQHQQQQSPASTQISQRAAATCSTSGGPNQQPRSIKKFLLRLRRARQRRQERRRQIHRCKQAAVFCEEEAKLREEFLMERRASFLVHLEQQQGDDDHLEFCPGDLEEWNKKLDVIQLADALHQQQQHQYGCSITET